MAEQQEQQVVWGEDGFASECGWAQAHCVDTRTGEYIGVQCSWVTVGTGLPAGAYKDEPPAHKDGYAIVRDDAEWAYVEDHRGSAVYDTATRQSGEITTLGPLQEGVTLLAPTSPYDVWDGVAWKHDDDIAQADVLTKAKAEQSQRLSVAAQQIAILKPAVEGGYAKPAHSKLLEDWLRYQYELILVPEQSGWPENPVWAEVPQKIF